MHKTGSNDASPSKEVDPGVIRDRYKQSLAGIEAREELQLGNELHSRCSICSTDPSVGSQASLLEGH